MVKRAIIVGSGRGVRRLDFTKSYPTALEPVGENKNAMDWILDALKRAGIDEIAFVGGYHIQKIIERYSQVQYHFQPDWQTHGEAAALLLARGWFDDACLVCSSEVLFLPAAIQATSGASAGLISAVWRPERVLDGDAEPSTRVAFALLNAEVARGAGALLERLVRERPLATLDDAVAAFVRGAPHAETVDVTAAAAPVRDRAAVARVLLGTKAQTLDRLRPLLRGGTILEQFRFSAPDWSRDPANITERIGEMYRDQHVIVRSSSHLEDRVDASYAGRYDSVADVRATDREAVAAAVSQVVASFDGPDVDDHRSEVFVQRQLRNPRASGVLFTRNPRTGARYYVINIDRRSARTDVVTSGAAGHVEKVVVFHDARSRVADPLIARLVLAASELQDLVFRDALDIEFAFDAAGDLFILQVRPLMVAGEVARAGLAPEDLDDEVREVQRFVVELSSPRPGLLGRSNVLGVMPDWNPAEMLGTHPRPLAVSLYQRLIGDRVWADARAAIGYRNVAPQALVVSLGGRPYVDVRASFNSFLPEGVDDGIGARLVEHQLWALRERPELHDKVEFEIAHTCLALDDDLLEGRCVAAGIDERGRRELRDRLLNLTDRMLLGVAPTIEAQLEHVAQLGLRCAPILRSVEGRRDGIGWAIHTLLEECKRLGTLPFSILARYAFVSTSFLRSLVRRGILSTDERDAIVRAIPTVGSELACDLAALARAEMTQSAFLARYGHLRPSSYDVTSPCYRQAPELYLGDLSNVGGGDARAHGRETARRVFAAKRSQIDAALASAGFRARTEDLVRFVTGSIPGRERAKFEFTRVLSAVLELAYERAQALGFTRDDTSYVPIDRFTRLATDSPSSAARTELLRDVEYRRKRWALSCSLELPQLIVDAADLESFTVHASLPNFVTMKRVTAAPLRLSRETPHSALDGAIVCIECADPGYDWLFAHPVAALVTRYGGIGSHMAIRAAELGLPAAIGCGELIFEEVACARLVEVDCAGQQVRVIR